MTWAEYQQNWKDRFGDGYQFGDFLGSLFGIDVDHGTIRDLIARYQKSHASGSNFWNALSGSGSAADFGAWLNDVTGTTASQNWQSNERRAGQDFTTVERIASQDFTHQENQLARDWQERMSNTAIQRQMADAQAAGVNPYYLFGGGSGSGAGVPMASGSSGSASGSNAPTAPGSGNSAAAVASAVSSVAGIIGTVIKALA